MIYLAIYIIVLGLVFGKVGDLEPNADYTPLESFLYRLVMAAMWPLWGAGYLIGLVIGLVRVLTKIP